VRVRAISPLPGVSFTLVARARIDAVEGLGRSLNELFWEHGPGAGYRFLLGVEFADGQRTNSLPVPGQADDVVLNQGGVGGVDTAIDQSWWLSPLRPRVRSASSSAVPTSASPR
jgi:hypothetical protein